MDGQQIEHQSPAGEAAADKLHSRGVVYFDGVCGLCDRSVRWILDHDHRRTFLFAPLQGTTAMATLPAWCRNDLKTVVLRQHGKYWIRTGAVCRILWGCGGIWRVAGCLLWVIPSPIRDLGYRFVAVSRYKLFGRLEACRMPKAEEQDRFLA